MTTNLNINDLHRYSVQFDWSKEFSLDVAEQTILETLTSAGFVLEHEYAMSGMSGMAENDGELFKFVSLPDQTVDKALVTIKALLAPKQVFPVEINLAPLHA